MAIIHDPSLPSVLPSVELFGIRIHQLRMAQAIGVIRKWMDQENTPCRYVVTPNVDHLVLLREQAALRQSYANADLVLADGFPIVWASRWFRRPLPERVAGSDLIPALFASATPDQPIRVFWLGAAPGVAERAGVRVGQSWPHVQTVGCDSPPIGFEREPSASERILDKIASAQPDLLVVGLGAPKQEIWVQTYRDRLAAKVALCAGATIDFMAGQRRRAPVWMRHCGLEWLHRAVSEPRRLVVRYLRDAWIFPQILWRQVRFPQAF